MELWLKHPFNRTVGRAQGFDNSMTEFRLGLPLRDVPTPN